MKEPGFSIRILALLALMAPTSFVASSETGYGFEVAPFAGYRLGSGIDIVTAGAESRGRLRFDDGESLGLVVNVDLKQPGKQAELYIARQDTRAYTSDILLEPDIRAIDVVIYQLQFGGLYFPGGKTTGGFASGVAGVTRLEPKSDDYRTHHRASIAIGAGYKLGITEHVLLRLDLRGIYTALDTGGSVFCSGGCTARFESSGYFQAEAGAGLVIRF